MKTSLHEVIEAEKAILEKKRLHQGIAGDAESLEKTLLGVALSGGGIRAGVTGLGFLKALQTSGLLKRVDYLSSVSGGGLASGHLLEHGEMKDELMDFMRDRSHPEGSKRLYNSFSIATYYVTGLFFSWITMAIIIGILYFFWVAFPVLQLSSNDMYLGKIAVVLGAIFVLHFISLALSPTISRFFIRLETLLIGVLVVMHAYNLLFDLQSWLQKIDLQNFFQIHQCLDDLDWFSKQKKAPLIVLFLFITGFFINPNRFLLYSYPNEFFARNFLLRNRSLLREMVFKNDSNSMSAFLPYPLFNATMSLRDEDHIDRVNGADMVGLYLMSPLFFGSKSTGFIKTDQYSEPKRTTLMAAIQISAAKMTMGVRPEGLFRLVAPLKLFSKFMGKLFNFNEYFYWVLNPRTVGKSRGLIWWPLYYFRELFDKIDMQGKLLPVSDGGNFDNLGVYALLQRKCKIILAMDCSYDPTYQFDDLRNLIVRAQNELGLAIIFRHDSTPEDVIAPRATNPYSDQRYAVADIIQLWEEVEESDPETGKVVKTKKRVNRPIAILIYTKATLTVDDLDSVVSSTSLGRLEYGTYKYKLHNKAFPHQSGAIDRITNPVQWQCYYQLGQDMVNEVLANVQFKDTGITFEDIEKAYKN